MTQPVTMLDAFQRTVGRRSNEPALLYLGTTITYGELDALSDALAAALRHGGLKDGDRVAGYLQNVPQFLITLVATWKAGGTFVSVSPMLRHKELRLLLEDSGASVLVVLESCWELVGRDVVGELGGIRVIATADDDFVGASERSSIIPDRSAAVSGVEDLQTLIAAHQADPVDAAPLEPNTVAVLTYTSGTTGPAKGAMNTHGNLVAASETYRSQARLTDGDVVLGMAPLFHVTGLTAHIGVAFMAGLPIVLTYRFDADLVLRAIEHHGPTFTVAAITAYVALMNAGSANLSSLRKTLSGGAPVAPALAEAWRAFSGVPLVPVYGLTETTGPTHMVPLDRSAPVHSPTGALSVGLPVPGTRARVVDDEGLEVPAGTAGELIVAGPQVVPGYWRQPEETANALRDGEMRTGDIALIDTEGWCYIVDRKKDLINASGYKVWPREVEDGLLAHPDVREAAVIGVPDGYRGESVRAYVSLRSGATVTGEQLVRYCRERMAAYKYPRDIIVLDELPKSGSGKILRRALRDELGSPT